MAFAYALFCWIRGNCSYVCAVCWMRLLYQSPFASRSIARPGVETFLNAETLWCGGTRPWPRVNWYLEHYVLLRLLLVPFPCSIESCSTGTARTCWLLRGTRIFELSFLTLLKQSLSRHESRLTVERSTVRSKQLRSGSSTHHLELHVLLACPTELIYSSCMCSW